LATNSILRPLAWRLGTMTAACVLAVSAFATGPTPVRAATESCDTVLATSAGTLAVHVQVLGCGDLSSDPQYGVTVDLFRTGSTSPVRSWPTAAGPNATVVDEIVTVPRAGGYYVEARGWPTSDPTFTTTQHSTAAVISDGGLVTVSIPTIGYRIAKMSPTGYPASVAWVNTSAHPAAQYVMQRSIDGGAFADYANLEGSVAGASLRLDVTLAPGHTWAFRVLGTNTVGAGTDGPWGTSATVAAKGYNELHPRFVYTGTWGTSYLSSHWGGRTRASKVAGSNAIFTFHGTAAAIVAPMGPTRGSFKVYADGVLRQTISTYSGGTSYRRVVYVIRWAWAGDHTIKIRVVGTAGHPRVDIDGIMTLE